MSEVITLIVAFSCRPYSIFQGAYALFPAVCLSYFGAGQHGWDFAQGVSLNLDKQ